MMTWLMDVSLIFFLPASRTIQWQNSRREKEEEKKTCIFWKLKNKTLILLIDYEITSPWGFNPMDGSPAGSSVHGILQARILQGAGISYYMGSSRPRDWTWVPAFQADSLLSEPPEKPIDLLAYYKVAS